MEDRITPWAAQAAEILVVDDQPEITALIADLLGEEGFRVRVAHDGASALSAIAARQPDLLLLDVSMPVLSGDQVLQQLRQVCRSELPVILMTADRAPERFAGLGANQLLRKPFDLGRLLDLVLRYVGRMGPALRA